MARKQIFAMLCCVTVTVMTLLSHQLEGGLRSPSGASGLGKKQHNLRRVDGPLQGSSSAIRLLFGARGWFSWRAEVPAPRMKRKEYPDVICPERIRRQFPHFSYPPVRPRSWKTVADVTNITTSTYEIVNPRSFYKVCDELELQITARNGRNESKQYGGDYFRAKIFTWTESFIASSSTDGEIVDHDNGSYSAYVTLKWTGTVNIVVTLIHSSEAVYVLNQIRDDHQPRQTYVGAFAGQRGRKKKDIESYCNYQLRNSSMVGAKVKKFFHRK